MQRAKPAPAVKPGVYDPLRFCIFTTIGLLAWAFGPAVVVMGFAAMGLWAYARAWQAGLRTSQCFLRDPRLVMGYLGAAFLAGAGYSMWQLLRWL